MAYERKYKVDLTIKDIWNKYKKENICPDIEEKVFKNILYDLNKTKADLLIRNSLEYRLPFRLGFLRIKKAKLKVKLINGKIDVNKNVIDWKATLDYWEKQYGTRNRKELKEIPNKKVIFQTNDHTDGEIMRWYWDKKLSNVKNKSVFLFNPVKGGVTPDGFYTGRKGLSKWINSEDRLNDYYY